LIEFLSSLTLLVSHLIVFCKQEITLGNEREWISPPWKLHNWDNDTKSCHSSVTVTIPTHNYDPTKAVQAVLKHNKLIDDELFIKAAQRHREDMILVWIYKDEDEITLRSIIDHLRTIIHIVYVYPESKCSEAIKFILCNRNEYIFVLVHASVEKILVKQIQHAVHIATIIVYDVFRSSVKSLTEFEQRTLVLYEIDLQHSIDLLAITVQSHRNHTFWFYESKQMKSADLSSESASFFWQLFLTRILSKMPSIDSQDFIDLALQWYKNNPLVLYEIQRFREEYYMGAAKDWMFNNGSSFIQRLLQQAFKQADMQIILAARFFIIDLMKSIELQHCSMCNIARITLDGLMSAKRMQFLLEHQDTFLMAKGFLMGRINSEKTINNLRNRPRYRNSVYAILFEIDLDDDGSVLVLNDEYVLFGLDVSFRIISIEFDQLLDIYKIRLRMIKANVILKQLWQSHTELLREVGDCIDDTVLFGTLLADMNRVPAAMDYYLSCMNNYISDRFFNTHSLVQIGRIALKCDKLDEAEEYYTLGVAAYETLLYDNDPSFIRLLLDLIFVYVKQEKTQQALCIYDRIELLLTNEHLFVSSTLRCWTQGLICLCQMTASNVQLARQMLETYFVSSKQLNYQCNHPLLIGGLAIDLGDVAYKQEHFNISNDCYTVALEIGSRNLPLCHRMIIVSLQRHLANVEILSVKNGWTLTIRETQLLPLLQETLSDINDDDNQKIADTMRCIGFEYATNGMHEKAKFYIEKCIPIYRQQSPLNEIFLNQCQAYIFQRENCPEVTLSTADQTKYMNDLHLSAWYKYTHPSNSTEAEEQQQLWSMLSSFVY
jgi:hypothetical protein